MSEAVATWFDVAGTVVLAYFFAINTSYLLLILLASGYFARHLRRASFAGYDEALASPLTLPVSVLLPAYNEQAGIVESVRAMLAVRYPESEIIVVDDGSTDGTFAALADAFDLVEVPRVVPDDVPTRGRILSVHVPAGLRYPVVVVRKENGGKTDALNVGINVAQYPLVCMVDADSLLDPEALLTVAKPFADDPQRVVATGGVVRVANNCRVAGGRVVDVRMPRSMLPAIQVVEYLRAFLLGRAGWSRLRSLLVISGAFGLFRRDVVVEIGGLDHETLGEDAELVVRLHRHLRDRKRDYRIVFVPEPVAWTEVPGSRAVLARQRRRWHRGLAEILWKHRRMVLNPRYGVVGMLGLPYYVIFELLAPLLELVGLLMLVLALVLETGSAVTGAAVDLVDGRFALLFLGLAYGYALLLSLSSLAVEEMSFHRYRRWSDLAIALAAAVAENIGYRQANAWWRLQGLWAAVRKTRPVWGSMTRAGFDTVRR